MRFYILILVATCLVYPAHQVISEAADSNRGNADHHTQSEEPEFIIGADLSFLDQLEEYGAVHRVNGVPKDVLQIVKDHWFTHVRLMLWHTPPENYYTLEKILYMAERIEAVGLKLHLDIFYSDTWTNPGAQTKPAAWADLPFETLKDSVYHYTRNVITALRNQNTLPDMSARTIKATITIIASGTGAPSCLAFPRITVWN